MYQTVESTSVENNLVMRGWERGVMDVKVGGLWTVGRGGAERPTV